MNFTNYKPIGYSVGCRVVPLQRRSSVVITCNFYLLNDIIYFCESGSRYPKNSNVRLYEY